MNLHRDLSPEEEKEFRQWARDNYVSPSSVPEIWHPIVRDECMKMDAEKLDTMNPSGLYVRMAWPGYQSFMENPDWHDGSSTIGNSDVLIPIEWVGIDTSDIETVIGRLQNMLDLEEEQEYIDALDKAISILDVMLDK
jgi:hypothetical protein